MREKISRIPPNCGTQGPLSQVLARDRLSSSSQECLPRPWLQLGAGVGPGEEEREGCPQPRSGSNSPRPILTASFPSCPGAVLRLTAFGTELRSRRGPTSHRPAGHSSSPDIRPQSAHCCSTQGPWTQLLLCPELVLSSGGTSGCGPAPRRGSRTTCSL